MANPSVNECPDFTITKIGDGISSADVHVLDGSVRYYWTYRVAGGTAPTLPATRFALDANTSEWVRFDSSLEFRPSAVSDLYVITDDYDEQVAKSGYVRVDA